MLPKAHLTSYSRRHQIKEFSILRMASCKPLGPLNPFFARAAQQSVADPVSLSTLLPVSPQLLGRHHGGGSICMMTASGALTHIWKPAITGGYDVSCLLIRQ